MSGRADLRVTAFSLGVGLVLGGPVFGLVGQLLGFPQMWAPGLTACAFGVTSALVAGIALLARARRNATEGRRGGE